MELQHVPMISPAVGLQSVDFLPEITGANGPSNRPEYESFFVLVQRANNFLRSNPHFTVNTCESVEFNVGNSGRNIDTLNSVYTAHGHNETRYIRALRLWMQTKSNPDGVCDQIGYGNFLPQIQGQGSTFSVETLDGVMARINHQFQQYPMPGRIITIETQPIKWGSSALDPDRTIWTERGSASTNFVNVIRIFFLQGPVQRCHVGVQDFLPGTLQTGLLLGDHPVMENFSIVAQRARDWLLSLPPNFQPVNVQTVTFRWSFNQGADTKLMTYHEDKLRLNYLRYLRVAFVVLDAYDGSAPRSLIHLGSKLITPIMAAPPGCCSGGAFESQESTRARVDHWVRATGARVVSVESLMMRLEGGGESRYGFESMHTWNETVRRNKSTRRADEQFVHLYRVYTDGHYQDPPGWNNSPELEQYAVTTRSRRSRNLAIFVGVLVLIGVILVGSLVLTGGRRSKS